MRDEDLRALCDAASCGPWRVGREPPPVRNAWFDAQPEGTYCVESTGTPFALGLAVAASPSQDDAAFIAAAREALPALLDMVQKVEADNAELIAMLDRGMQLVDDSRVAKVAKLREALVTISTCGVACPCAAVAREALAAVEERGT